MRSETDRAAEWVYRGVWGVLAGWFKVPHEPPTLPTAPGGFSRSFKPAPEFLRYMKVWFWLGLIWPDVVVVLGWSAVMLTVPWLGLLLAPVALALAILPDIVAYVALHLRYDTTWYVVTDRSLRIRRGIWVIHETTITFENVQNLRITQGPLQRFMGIATLVVETAGGGSEHGKGQSSAGGHRGVIEGVTNAEELRDLILLRLRASRSSGLGEESRARQPHGWTAAHVDALREIREALGTLE